MANVKRLIGLLAVLFAALALTGCHSDCEIVWAYSGIQPFGENFGYDTVKRFLEKSPECINFKGKDGATPLHMSAGSGRERIAKLLIACQADVNARNDDEQTPLMLAANFGHKGIVQVLVTGKIEISPEMDISDPVYKSIDESVKTISSNVLTREAADINAVDTYGYTALHHAVDEGHEEIVELLISKGADVNTKDKWGSTPLHRASQEGHADVAELLIAKGADVNEANEKGQSPLHRAAQKGHKDIVELLIAKGADVNAKEKWGGTALHRATEKDHKDIVELLITNVADINAKGVNGSTALHTAISGDHKDIAELLIAKGADVNSRDEWGNTPLIYAVYATANNPHMDISEFVDISKLLIAKGADIGSKNDFCWTVLHYAVCFGKKDLVELLRKHGAVLGTEVHDAAERGDTKKVKSLLEQNPELLNADDAGWTPLHSAIAYDRRNIVKLLIDKGAELETKANEATTALHVAVTLGRYDIVKVLIDKGANINAKEQYGRTPLHIAVNNAVNNKGYRNLVELLIAQESNVNSKDIKGSTPLHFAAMRGDMYLVKLLIRNGAEVNVRNEYGTTPMDGAKQQNHEEIAALLRKHGAVEPSLNSIWHGTCDQPGYEPYPMILFVKDRKGDSFEGVTWYPECALSKYKGGLLEVSGKIGPENIVRFTEDKVIHGNVVSGSNYTATVEGNTLKGSYEVGEILLKSGVSSVKTHESRDLFEVHSIWQGTCDQPGYRPYPMILFINEREGEAFEGTTWYPACVQSKYKSGLLKVSGKIGPDNSVSFSENEVIYGKVVSGCKYSATLEENALKGGWDWVNPRSSEVVKGNIVLKRVD